MPHIHTCRAAHDSYRLRDMTTTRVLPTIAAHEANPSTEVLIESAITTDFGSLTHFEWVTVAFWKPCGDGYAGLVSTRGQWCGQFLPGDILKVRA